jgi:periplasmic protein TonB
MTANHSDQSLGDKEREWMDAFMGEIRDPNTLLRIDQQLKEHPEWHESYAKLDRTVQQLRAIYPNQRNPMIDLTLEQKKELYSSITNLQTADEPPVSQWLRTLRIFGLALGAATLVLSAVPLVQWISMPTPPAKPMDTNNPNTVIPAPEIIEVPPVETIPDQKDEPHEKIEYRPDINQLTYPDQVGGLSGYGNVIKPTYDLQGPSLMEECFSILEVDVIPTPSKTVAPVYPAQQRQDKTSGKVLLEFVVDEKGVVSQVKVVQSSHAAFNQPAIDALRKWTFEPGLKDGKAVKVRMRIPLIFNARS